MYPIQEEDVGTWMIRRSAPHSSNIAFTALCKHGYCNTHASILAGADVMRA